MQPGSLPREHELNELLKGRSRTGTRIGEILVFEWPSRFLRLRRFDGAYLCFVLANGSRTLDPKHAAAAFDIAEPNTSWHHTSRLIVCICDGPVPADFFRLNIGTLLEIDAGSIDFSGSDGLLASLQSILLTRGNWDIINPFAWNHACPPSMFFGRDAQIQAVIREPSRSFAIVGPRRIGKTSLLHFLPRALAAFPGQTFVYVDAFSISDYREFFWMVLNNLVGSARYTWEAGAQRQPLEHLILQTAGKLGARFVVAIDEFDQVVRSKDPEMRKVRSLFSNPRLHGRCRFIVAGYTDLWRELTDSRSSYFNLFHTIQLTTFTQEEAEKFAAVTLGDLQLGLTRPVDVIQRLVSLSGGIPWLLQRLCSQLLSEVLESDVSNTDELIELISNDRDMQQSIFESLTMDCSETANLLLSALAGLDEADEEQIRRWLTAHGLQLPLNELLRELRLLVMSGALVASRKGFRVSNEILRRYLRLLWPFQEEAVRFHARRPEARISMSRTAGDIIGGDKATAISKQEASSQQLGASSFKNFFVSYNKADEDWATWIAWVLENSGYTVVIQAWDFPPGANFVHEMQTALQSTAKVIVVLSVDYLKSQFAAAEWYAAFREDPTGSERQLVPIRVRECNPSGLLGQIIYADLVGLSEPQARARLLQAFGGRTKPISVAFPGCEPNVGLTGSKAVRYPG